MPVERSAGAVIFRQERGKVYYLLLDYPTGSRNKKEYWDLPKGHIEKGEDEIGAARREVGEETGLKDIQFIAGFKETIRYFFRVENKTILKFVTFFLVKSKEKEVKISFEHKGFKWLPLEEAIEQLTFKNAKETIRKADDFLSRKGL